MRNLARCSTSADGCPASAGDSRRTRDARTSRRSARGRRRPRDARRTADHAAASAARERGPGRVADASKRTTPPGALRTCTLTRGVLAPRGRPCVGGGGRTRGRARGGGGDDDDEGNHRTTRSGEGRAVDERGRSLEARTRRRLDSPAGATSLARWRRPGARARGVPCGGGSRGDRPRGSRGADVARTRSRGAWSAGGRGTAAGWGAVPPRGADAVGGDSTLARVSRPPVHLYEYQCPEKEIAKNRDYAATWKRYLADAFDSAFFIRGEQQELHFSRSGLPGVVASARGARCRAVEGRLGGGG